MEFSTLIFISIFNVSVNTSNFGITGVFSACIVIVTGDYFVNTSDIWITGEFITFVGIIASVRGISDNASLAWITFCVVAIIWGDTLVRIISVNTTIDRAAMIISTFIIVITDNFFVFTRIIFITVRITTVLSTFIVVITFYFLIFTTAVRVASYRVASIFVFALVYFIFAST
jgi:hypothetical protein